MITVIGLGFVGLTTALGFSEKGYNVFGYDIDENKVTKFMNGEVPFFEPSLDVKLKNHLNKRFKIVNDLSDAIEKSEIIFLCVGTPNQEDGSVDLQYIYSAIKSVIEKRKKQNFKVLVVKSTVPPGTTDEKIKPFIEQLGCKVGKDIGLTNNPEFLREGYAWADFVNPDRIVIGENDKKSGQIIENIYRKFDAPIYRVTLNSAEFIKYLSNTLLATLISFANEQSLIAKSIANINIKKAFEILHLDKRWFGNPAPMTSYVFPGCGFGGYCLPKDTKALIHQAKENFYHPELLEKVLKVNDNMKDFVVRDILNEVKENEKVGILGLAFKPNSNDIRDTPTKSIIESLLDKGITNIVAYDPMAMDEFQQTFQFPIDYAPNLISLLSNVDHIVILTGWQEFKDHEEVIKTKNVFDYRYLLNE